MAATCESGYDYKIEVELSDGQTFTIEFDQINDLDIWLVWVQLKAVMENNLLKEWIELKWPWWGRIRRIEGMPISAVVLRKEKKKKVWPWR